MGVFVTRRVLWRSHDLLVRPWRVEGLVAPMLICASRSLLRRLRAAGGPPCSWRSALLLLAMWPPGTAARRSRPRGAWQRLVRSPARAAVVPAPSCVFPACCCSMHARVCVHGPECPWGQTLFVLQLLCGVLLQLWTRVGRVGTKGLALGRVRWVARWR